MKTYKKTIIVIVVLIEFLRFCFQPADILWLFDLNSWPVTSKYYRLHGVFLLLFFIFPFFNYLLSVDWNNVGLKSPQTKNYISATFCHVFGGGLNRIAANLRGGPTTT